jgi:hypothetical protein
VYPAHLPGGSNVTIEVIHRTLTRYIEGDESAGISKKKLPPVLYLQLDNTAKYFSEWFMKLLFVNLFQFLVWEDCANFKNGSDPSV